MRAYASHDELESSRSATPLTRPKLTRPASPAHDRYASLHELELRGNPISDDLHVACMEQLLLNNLPRLYDRSLRAARDAKAADGSDGVGGKSPARKGKSRRALDEDKDGMISRDELAAALRAYAIRLSDAEIDFIFSKLDKDGNGCDFNEFFSFFGVKGL